MGIEKPAERFIPGMIFGANNDPVIHELMEYIKLYKDGHISKENALQRCTKNVTNLSI